MNRLFKKYENLILLFCLLIFSAVLLSNNARGQRHRNLLERLVLTVVAPVQDAVTNSIRDVILMYNRYFQLVDVTKENTALRKMLGEQVYKNNLLREELKKYRRVDTLVSQSHDLDTKHTIIAGVSAWDSTNSAKTMVIDKGERDGVANGMIVMTNFGLVGRVVTVSNRASRVLLITDARSAVDAYVQRTRARLTVVGENQRACDLKYLSVKDDAKEGDMLVSSGLGGVFPAGIQIGRITSVETGPSRLYAKGTMVPSANLDRLEEVIVTKFAPPEAKPATPAQKEEDDS
ncbi:MAG: rod shape-determining protein MreC [Nitrospinae bacterium]|nr:rod shape-determining protein MreC [Nitrospinota bacterium]